MNQKKQEQITCQSIYFLGLANLASMTLFRSALIRARKSFIDFFLTHAKSFNLSYDIPHDEAMDIFGDKYIEFAEAVCNYQNEEPTFSVHRYPRYVKQLFLRL